MLSGLNFQIVQSLKSDEDSDIDPTEATDTVPAVGQVC